MNHIDIKRPVIVKVIMTDSFRSQLIGEAGETMKRIEDNLASMQKAFDALPRDGSDPLRARKESDLQVERERLEQLRKELTWRVSELEGVQNGAEVPYRVLDGSVVLNVGDNFLQKMSQAEIVIKDWQIMEIRGV